MIIQKKKFDGTAELTCLDKELGFEGGADRIVVVVSAWGHAVERKYETIEVIHPHPPRGPPAGCASYASPIPHIVIATDPDDVCILNSASALFRPAASEVESERTSIDVYSDFAGHRLLFPLLWIYHEDVVHSENALMLEQYLGQRRPWFWVLLVVDSDTDSRNHLNEAANEGINVEGHRRSASEADDDIEPAPIDQSVLSVMRSQEETTLLFDHGGEAPKRVSLHRRPAYQGDEDSPPATYTGRHIRPWLPTLQREHLFFPTPGNN